MSRRKLKRKTCHFCSREFEDGDSAFYIYPVPGDEPGHTEDSALGVYACGDCQPDVLNRQVEMGLVSLQHLEGSDE